MHHQQRIFNHLELYADAFEITLKRFVHLLHFFYLAHEGKKVSELRATYPPYFIAKNRVDLTPEIDVDAILAKVKEIYKNEEINDIDGVKIDFADKWVHLRKSNTEPIIRVYSEASTMEAAEEIGQKIMDVINELAK